MFSLNSLQMGIYVSSGNATVILVDLFHFTFLWLDCNLRIQIQVRFRLQSQAYLVSDPFFIYICLRKGLSEVKILLFFFFLVF